MKLTELFGKLRIGRPSKKEAEAAANAPNVPSQAATPTTPNEITNNELCDRYWKHALEYYTLDRSGRLSGDHVNLGSLIKKLRENCGTLKLSEFGPVRLMELQAKLVDSGLCRKSINKRVGDSLAARVAREVG